VAFAGTSRSIARIRIGERSQAIYSQGNLVIANGRLHVGTESLPLVNIRSVSERTMMRPKRHWAVVMLASGVLVLAGYRFSNHWPGWVLIGLGALLGSWGWFFHRRRVLIIRLNLLLNQRINVLFNEAEDARGFLTALKAAKGGELPVAPLR
jgi:hypothetical protein